MLSFIFSSEFLLIVEPENSPLGWCDTPPSLQLHIPVRPVFRRILCQVYQFIMKTEVSLCTRGVQSVESAWNKYSFEIKLLAFLFQFVIWYNDILMPRWQKFQNVHHRFVSSQDCAFNCPSSLSSSAIFGTKQSWRDLREWNCFRKET